MTPDVLPGRQLNPSHHRDIHTSFSRRRPRPCFSKDINYFYSAPTRGHLLSYSWYIANHLSRQTLTSSSNVASTSSNMASTLALLQWRSLWSWTHWSGPRFTNRTTSPSISHQPSSVPQSFQLWSSCLLSVLSGSRNRIEHKDIKHPSTIRNHITLYLLYNYCIQGSDCQGLYTYIYVYGLKCIISLYREYGWSLTTRAKRAFLDTSTNELWQHTPLPAMKDDVTYDCNPYLSYLQLCPHCTCDTGKRDDIVIHHFA